MVFEGEPPYFLKTHQLQPRGDRRTIYVVRNGADAVRSLFDYHRGEIPLDQIIRGWRFGTWSRHLETWIPTPEPDTLVLRYEDMRRDLRPVVDVLSAFIGRAPVTRTLPERSRLADGKWIRVAADKQPFTAEERALFDEITVRPWPPTATATDGMIETGRSRPSPLPLRPKPPICATRPEDRA